MQVFSIYGDFRKGRRTMRFQILHEIKGRMRLHIIQKRMTDVEADILEYYLNQCEEISSAKVYERTQDVVI